MLHVLTSRMRPCKRLSCIPVGSPVVGLWESNAFRSLGCNSPLRIDCLPSESPHRIVPSISSVSFRYFVTMAKCMHGTRRDRTATRAFGRTTSRTTSFGRPDFASHRHPIVQTRVHPCRGSWPSISSFDDDGFHRARWTSLLWKQMRLG